MFSSEIQSGVVIGRSYKLTKKLGSGAFAEIFHGINLKTNMKAAVKLELSIQRKLYERLLQVQLGVDKGTQNVYYCATEGEYNLMVMDLLDPSLEDLFNLCCKKFSLKSVLMLADQMIQDIQYVHSRHFLHEDIKPENFLIGTGKRAHKVYIIDFGLAKKQKYFQQYGKHIPYKEGKNQAGTVSINAHSGVEQGKMIWNHWVENSTQGFISLRADS